MYKVNCCRNTHLLVKSVTLGNGKLNHYVADALSLLLPKLKMSTMVVAALFPVY
jgi:hypothetical protein